MGEKISIKFHHFIANRLNLHCTAQAVVLVIVMRLSGYLACAYEEAEANRVVDLLLVYIKKVSGSAGTERRSLGLELIKTVSTPMEVTEEEAPEQPKGKSI